MSYQVFRRALHRRLISPCALTATALAFIALAGFDASPAAAHCFVGSRFFPATLSVDDPCVADELSMPTISSFKTGDLPANRELDISGEVSKRITEDFGVSIGRTYTRLWVPGGPNASGWQNLETTFKYQFLTWPQSEFVVSTGVSVEWGRTGNASVGAEKFHTVTPTLWVGKGMGDLPSYLGFVRAFGLTGQVGYAIPSWRRTVTTSIDPDSGDFTFDEERHPHFLQYGGSIQFSMPYLKANVVDLGLPDVFNRMVPLVEANFRTPVANNIQMPNVWDENNRTTGSVNPGIIYVTDKFQIGAEAVIPINRASGKGIGWVAQLHFYLDDIFPTTYGRPIIPISARIGQ
ncbi:MAG: hypothetical protein QOF41_2127 [Methylobacteriaceae bacterium]|nr:hypothetical protein [Methylobacteriaceae bacterium]